MGLSEIPLYREKLFELTESVLSVPIPGVWRGEVLEEGLGGPAIVKAMFTTMALFILEDDVYLLFSRRAVASQLPKPWKIGNRQSLRRQLVRAARAGDDGARRFE